MKNGSIVGFVWAVMLGVVAFAGEPVKLSVDSPPNGILTNGENVVFQGTAPRAKYVLINNEKISVGVNGQFKAVKNFSNGSVFQDVTIEAQGEDGQTQKVVRRIYIHASKTVASAQKVANPSTAKPVPKVNSAAKLNPEPKAPVATVQVPVKNKPVTTPKAKSEPKPVANAETKPQKMASQMEKPAILLDADSLKAVKGGHVALSGTVRGINRLRVNGVRLAINQNRFYYNYPLKPGNNQLTFQGKTSQNQWITLKQSVYIQPGHAGTVPGIRFVFPRHNYRTDESKIVLRIQVNHGNKLKINGEEVALDEKMTAHYPVTFDSATKRNYIFICDAFNENGQKVTRTLTIVHQINNKPEIEVLTSGIIREANQWYLSISGFVRFANQVWVNDVSVPVSEIGKFSVLQPVSEAIANSGTNVVIRAMNAMRKSITFNVPVKSVSGQADTSIAATPANEDAQITVDSPVAEDSSGPVIEFSDPYEQTGNPQIYIQGSARTAQRLMVNGRYQRIRRDGKFRIYHYLAKPGVNTLNFKAWNAKGITEKVLSINYDPALKDIPELVLFNPTGNTWEKPQILFKGLVRKTRALTINDQAVSFNRHDGRFFVRLPLIPGENNFEIKLTSPSSKTVTVKRTVTAGLPDVQVPEEALVPQSAPKQAQQAMTKSYKRTLDDNEEDLFSETATVSKSTKSAGARKKPTIELASPEQNYSTMDSEVGIAGRVKNCKELYINEQKVKVQSDGHFSHSIALPIEGKNIITITAVGEANQVVSLSRTVIKKTTTLTAVNNNSMSLKLKNALSKRISLDLSDAQIKDVLNILAEKGDLNIVSDMSLSGIVSLSIKNVAISDAIDIILNTQGLSYKLVENTIIIANPANLKNPTSYKTEVIKLNNLDSKAIATLTGPYLSGDERVNVLSDVVAIYADPKKVDLIKRVIQAVDSRKIPQIMLEARIIETASNALENLGMTWPRSEGFKLFGAESNQVISATELTIILNMLEEKGLGKIIARPQLKAMDNQQSEIFIGDEIPYISTTFDGDRKTETVSFKQVGITLKMLPKINSDTKEITIKVEPEVSYISGYQGLNNDMPVVRTRRVSTTVSVKDGETVIIAGLFNSSDMTNQTKVAGISDIPLFGNLFQSGRKSQDNTELVLAITPHITSSISDVKAGSDLSTIDDSR